MTDETPEAPRPAGRKLTWSVIWIGVSCIVLCVITLVVSVEISNARIRQFCALVVSSDDAYQSAPPSKLTPTGQRIAGEMHALRLSLGCPKESTP